MLPGQIPLNEGIERLKPLLEDASVLKIAHNMKYDCVVLARYGVNLTPVEDTMLISYALDSGRNNHGLDELTLKHLGHEKLVFCVSRGLRTQFRRLRTRAAR